MKYPAILSIVVGGMMLVMWSFIIISGQVPDLERDFMSLVMHWAAEFITAVALITGGAGLLKKMHWSVILYPLSMGLLFYTLIASPGWYAQRGQWEMVIMFAVFFIAALVALVVYMTKWRIHFRV